jgi:hypothetical protein
MSKKLVSILRILQGKQLHMTHQIGKNKSKEQYQFRLWIQPATRVISRKGSRCANLKEKKDRLV